MGEIDLQLTTVLVSLFFGTNFFLFLLFESVRRFGKVTEQKVSKDRKQLSKPFVGSLDCFINLTSELCKLGAILAATYICEHHPFFEHSQKSYSRDLFLFVLIIFFGYAFYTLKPIHDLTLLGREQTEEWKGWMQFIFLLYHYFHAEEVYNSVRVMITCYVWMTGFGNFSFFYIKQDFGWLRVMQMMWRLNFSVLLLMWTHSNTYILYYICPLHTFYFLMVYATMYAFSSINHSKWGIRVKLLVLGVLIYIVWDINGGLFDILFGWLGTDSIIGAKSGSVWEYYFRTSLDHYSSYLGMIFALNFPLAEQYFVKAKGWPLIFASLCMGAAFLWWFQTCYMQPKLEYNLSHSYFAIIPLTAYIFFRNITPRMRSMVSMSLHDLGKTTLETYLLQHHLWLTSNAKTLLTIVPNSPYVNFAFATIVFFVVSKELYRLTMSLRGMMLPDDKNIAWKNLVGLSGLVAGFYCLAVFMHSAGASLFFILWVSLLLAVGAVLAINRLTRSFSENFYYQEWSRRFLYAAGALLVIGVMFSLPIGTPGGASSSSSSPPTLAAAVGAASITHFLPAAAFPFLQPPQSLTRADRRRTTGYGNGYGYSGNDPSCLDALSVGHWETSSCADDQTAVVFPPSTSFSSSFSTSFSTSSSASSTMGYCSKDQWFWESASEDCPIRQVNTAEAQRLFLGKNVVFYGDSIVRNAFHQFVHLVDPSYSPSSSSSDTSLKHSDIVYTLPTHLSATLSDSSSSSGSGSGSVAFVWAPMVRDISAALDRTAVSDKGVLPPQVYDMAVFGSTCWEALYTRNIETYTAKLDNLTRTHSGYFTDSSTTATISSGNDGSIEKGDQEHSKTLKLWLQPTKIVDALLNTPEKRQYMTDDIVQAYRTASAKSTLSQYFDTTVNPYQAAISRESGTADGVHYSEEVYDVLAQMIANGFLLHHPDLASAAAHSAPDRKTQSSSSSYTPRKTGSMSLPYFGALVLLLSAVMLFTMDSFLGIGFLSLLLAGRFQDWDEAYVPLHNKILGPSSNSSSSNATGGGGGLSGGLGEGGGVGTSTGVVERDPLLLKSSSKDGIGGDVQTA